MLGAIIGDLSATTWRADKTVFYKQLFSDEARLSEYGNLAYKIMRHLILDEPFDYRGFIQSQEPLSWEKISHFNLIAMALFAWVEDDPTVAIEKFRQKFAVYYWEKEDFYALNSIIPIIIALRQGNTKDEALKSMDEMFWQNIIQWSKSEQGSLGAIARAWDAFYRWHDFTSVIHSAVKSPVEPNLTAIIAGLFAEATYGCQIGMLKKKYSSEPYFFLNKIDIVDVDFILRYDEDHRKFFPKNRALTNVELHHWKPCLNPYEGKTFFRDVFEGIRMAFDTDWEDRFGIYLDNGWYYVYRSHYLLLRFKIVCEEGRYRITDVQCSGEKDEQIALSAMVCAIKLAQCQAYHNDPVTLWPNDNFTN